MDEAEFCDYDTGGAEGIPYVAQVLTEVLRVDVCVGIAFVVVDPPVFLHTDCNETGKVEWVGCICSESVNTTWRRGCELSSVRVGVKEAKHTIDMTGHDLRTAEHPQFAMPYRQLPIRCPLKDSAF